MEKETLFKLIIFLGWASNWQWSIVPRKYYENCCSHTKESWKNTSKRHKYSSIVNRRRMLFPRLLAAARLVISRQLTTNAPWCQCRGRNFIFSTCHVFKTQNTTYWNVFVFFTQNGSNHKSQNKLAQIHNLIKPTFLPFKESKIQRYEPMSSKYEK